MILPKERGSQKCRGALTPKRRPIISLRLDVMPISLARPFFSIGSRSYDFAPSSELQSLFTLPALRSHPSHRTSRHRSCTSTPHFLHRRLPPRLPLFERSDHLRRGVIALRHTSSPSLVRNHTRTCRKTGRRSRRRTLFSIFASTPSKQLY